jgi:tetratricopeptide (TPR) repeat protein
MMRHDLRRCGLPESMRWLLALALMTLCVGRAVAQAPIPGYPDLVTAYDPREVAMLPWYCRHTQLFRDRVPGGKDPAGMSLAQERLGVGYLHMHHYCWGLMKLTRAKVLAKDGTARSFYYASAIDEFNYVIEHVPGEYFLLPEILTRKGEAFAGLGRSALAVAEFEKAIELRPEYWPPYGHLADLHIANGEFGKAREWLDRGLKQVPDAAGLRRRLQELDRRESGQARERPAKQPR